MVIPECSQIIQQISLRHIECCAATAEFYAPSQLTANEVRISLRSVGLRSVVENSHSVVQRINQSKA